MANRVRQIPGLGILAVAGLKEKDVITAVGSLALTLSLETSVPVESKASDDRRSPFCSEDVEVSYLIGFSAP
jgi:hypothetical protein